jgi:hypothetical protein
MSAVPNSSAANDDDSLETQEWLDALEAVIDREGPQRAHFLLEALTEKARRSGAFIPFSAHTAYINTIPVHLEARSPGNAEYEERIRSYIRWNAMAMVVRANRLDPPDGGDLGGHRDQGVRPRGQAHRGRIRRPLDRRRRRTRRRRHRCGHRARTGAVTIPAARDQEAHGGQEQRAASEHARPSCHAP